MLNDAVHSQIKTAEIAYGKDPTYERYASTQPVGLSAIRRLLATNSADAMDSSKQIGSALNVPNGDHELSFQSF